MKKKIRIYFADMQKMDERQREKYIKKMMKDAGFNMDKDAHRTHDHAKGFLEITQVHFMEDR